MRSILATGLVCVLVALGSVTITAQGRGGQGAPAPLQNLQVLPQTMTRQEVTALMRSFTAALGVQCSHCHVGSNAPADRAKDDLPAKATARKMLQLSMVINNDLLKDVGTPCARRFTQGDVFYVPSWRGETVDGAGDRRRLLMSVMRKALLWASTNQWIHENALQTGFVRRSVKKFMPGEKIEDAIKAAVELKPVKLNTILTRLGENISHISEADEVCEHYLKVIDLIQAAGIDSQISVKPTQLAYDQDPEVCVRHCMRLIERCEQTKTFFWLDMESSPYVDGTIALFKRLRERTPNIGIAIQAYLFRTEKDIEELVALGSAIRMVKGAYLEPPTVAFPNKADVDENYFKICARLLQDDAKKPGALLHIATHDVSIQERLLKVIADRKVTPDRYEFAMLYGIQTERQKQLAASGQSTRCLISYGERWFPWYMRRLAERPANVWFVVKNMFSS